MRSQRQRDTGPELALRRRLHAKGLRFRLQVPVPGTRRAIDVAFPRARLAVDVRGCYWHGCPDHGSQARANAEWWRAKLEANRARDADTERRLREAGWQVLVVWDHEQPEDAADRVARALSART